ncbi:hypothetical protein [Chryseobacterium defluvii]|uniref:Lipoprotein n=1 Tax=Chryseobacterium defluvii TaxID=160396 RepID=A0A495SLD1_9FLAO|nr:hypothetical protein [Chryseobacterium defluvii]RKT01081.1 hypothetical protein BCF58_0292 [Chryseobacterium defluvii]
MKTTLFLLLAVLFFSCEENRDSEYYNPNHLIRVNFETKQAWDGGKELKIASENATNICTQIIRNSSAPEAIKYDILCFGANDKGTNFAYLKIKNSAVDGVYLIEYDNARALVHHSDSYFQADCGLKWIISEN